MNTRLAVRAGLSLSAVLWAGAASAADRTWDGGSTLDSKWSSVTNWDGDTTAPGAGDTLFFGASSRLAITNDLGAGLSFAGLSFASGAGAYSLFGDGITLGGTLTNASANTQTLNLPLALDATRKITSSGGAITLNGMLSGAGGWTKEGSARVTLSASNSYDGATLISTGVVTVTHGWGLGSTNGATTVSTTGRARLEISGGLTLAEPLFFSGSDNSVRCFQNVSGSNTLTGPITLSNGRFGVDGGTLVIAGGISGNPFFVLNGGGTIYVRSTPLTMGSGTFYADDSSLTIFDVASNAWGELTIAKGTVRMNVKDALPPGATIRFGLNYGPWGTFDLNGFDQTTTRLYDGGTNSPNRSLTSATPALLTINQSVASSLLETRMTGAFGLVKMGTGTLIVSNVTSTTTGSMIVSNGTLVVAIANSLGFSTNVVVGGGTLELRTSEGITNSASLSIADGGLVKIGTGLTETVAKLFINGTQQVKGTYGITASLPDHPDDAHFSGAGLLNVLQDPPIIPTNYVWDATGPDTLLNTASNWVNDVEPEMAGTSILAFGTGGSTATVNTNASLYGITFNRDAAFTLAAGDGALTLGLGGLSAAAPTATARAYTISEDITLLAPQAWMVTNAAGGTTLTVSGRIDDGADAVGFTKLGNGGLVLSGSNTFDGVVTNWGGGIQISHSNALGSTLGGTVINTAGASSAYLSFYGGITLAEPLTFIGGSVNGGCVNNNGGTNTISGPIVTAGGRYVAGGGTVLNITGGVTGPNPFFVVNAQGTVAFTTTPLNLGTGTFHTDSGGLTILGVASNKWGDTLFTGGTLRTDVAYAFPTSTLLKVGGVWYGPHCTLNLNGFDQTVGNLSRAEPTPGTIVITSPTPAVLTVNQSGNYGYDGAFAGQVTLVKNGAGTLTLTNASTSTAGSFIVSNGTLVVARNGTLGLNSTNIVVAGNGTLALSNSVAIADSAAVTMPGAGVATAKIALAPGVNEKVGWLFLGDKMMRAGVYGSSGSPAPAANQDNEHFAGSGVLTVLKDKSGTTILIQ